MFSVRVSSRHTGTELHPQGRRKDAMMVGVEKRKMRGSFLPPFPPFFPSSAFPPPPPPPGVARPMVAGHRRAPKIRQFLCHHHIVGRAINRVCGDDAHQLSNHQYHLICNNSFDQGPAGSFWLLWCRFRVHSYRYRCNIALIILGAAGSI